MTLEEKIIKLKTKKIYNFHIKHSTPITMEEAREKAESELKWAKEEMKKDLHN